MRNEKRMEIKKNINCHKGQETLKAVMSLLPASCENCTRKQITDILNATQTAFHDGKREAENEISDAIGENIWQHIRKLK